MRAEGGQYAASCDEPGVASCGDTVQGAFRAIEEATLLYLNMLNVIEAGGERGRVLAEHDTEVTVRARPDEYVSPHAVAIPAAASLQQSGTSSPPTRGFPPEPPTHRQPSGVRENGGGW